MFFYLPHVRFVATYGLDARHNDGRDPFESSMCAQYELTRRFMPSSRSATFPIMTRNELSPAWIQWTADPDPNVRAPAQKARAHALGNAVTGLREGPRPALPILRRSRTTLTSTSAAVWQIIWETSPGPSCLGLRSMRTLADESLGRTEMAHPPARCAIPPSAWCPRLFGCASGKMTMARDDSFKEFILDQLQGLGEIDCRAMFGGYGLYHRGVFLAILFKDRLYFKTSPGSRKPYVEKGMRSFKPNSKQTLELLRGAGGGDREPG